MFGGDGKPGLRPARLELQYGAPELLAEREDLRLSMDLPVVDAREAQHVIDEPDEPVGLLRDVLAVLALLGIGKTAFGEKLGIAVENGERRFELVGYARNEVLAQIFVGAELRRHKIEVAFKLAEFLHAVTLRHGDIVIAPGDLARGAGELADGIRR